MSQPRPLTPDPELVDRIFSDALALPIDERAAFVQDQCQGDESLTAAVMQLMTVYGRLGGFAQPEPHQGPRLIGQCSANELIANRFEIRELLGAGGMGEVYLAYDRTVMDRVALKFIREDFAGDPEMRARLRREVRSRTVAHSNICPIFDLCVEKHEGRLLTFFSMAYLDGVTLAEALRARGRLPLDEVSTLIAGIADGLDAAHRAGIVHRDLKPGNIILVTERNGTLRPVITDFGLAKSQLHSIGDAETNAHVLLGSPAYMAPEQFLDAEVTQAADIYALGLIAYELISGKRPFPDEFLVKAAVRRQREAAPDLSKECPGIPDSWSCAVGSALKAEPASRPPTAGVFAAALTLPARPRSRMLFVRRRRWALSVCAAAFAVALFLAGIRLLRQVPGRGSEVSLVVSPIVNTTNDQSLDGVTALLSEDLAQSPNIRITRRDQISETSARMRKPIDTPAAWREVAARLGASFLTFGSLSQVGDHFVFNVRAEQPKTPWWSTRGRDFSEVCESKSTLVPCVHRMAVSLRVLVGETAEEITKQSRSLEDVTTRSWDAWTLFREGQEQAYAGQRTQAIATFRAALERDPQFALAKARLGDELFTLRRQAEGLGAWRDAIADADGQRLSRREELRIRTEYALEMGDNSIAEGWLLRWRREFAYDAEPLFHLCGVYRASGQYQESLRAAQEMARLGGDARLAWGSAARSAILLKDKAAALEAVRKLREAGQTDEADFTEGALYASRSDFLKATRFFTRLSKSTDAANASQGNTALAYVVAEQGDWADASALLASGISADQQRGQIGLASVKLTERAFIELTRGNPGLAGALAQQALETEPGVDTLTNGVIILARTNRIQEAKHALLRFDPGIAGTRYEAMRLKLQGEIELAQDKYERAVDLLEKESRLAPQTSVRESLVRALLIKGDREQGRLLVKHLEEEPALIWIYPAGTWPGVLRSLRNLLHD